MILNAITSTEKKVWARAFNMNQKFLTNIKRNDSLAAGFTIIEILVMLFREKKTLSRLL